MDKVSHLTSNKGYIRLGSSNSISGHDKKAHHPNIPKPMARLPQTAKELQLEFLRDELHVKQVDFLVTNTCKL